MRAAFLAPFLLVLACGGETSPNPPQATATEAAPAPQPPPSSEDAHPLVAHSAAFSEYQFTNAAYTLPLQQSMMSEPARQVARDLARAGWIAVDGAGTVVVTSKARSDKRFIVRPNGVVDIVPLARKEVTAVDAVRVDPDGTPLVDFRWEWVPNEIGKLFGDRYAGEQHAAATLLWDGTQWTVLLVARREGT